MKLRLKEDPKEWRKTTLLTVLGVVAVSAFLRWRQVLPVKACVAILVMAGIVASSAWARPQWFRGFYRVSTRVGFVTSQMAGRAVLAMMFLLLLTPLGLILRLAGKDALQLKRRREAKSYWTQAKESTPLERLF
jgi:hypothetical protein